MIRERRRASLQLERCPRVRGVKWSSRELTFCPESLKGIPHRVLWWTGRNDLFRAAISVPLEEPCVASHDIVRKLYADSFRIVLFCVEMRIKLCIASYVLSRSLAMKHANPCTHVSQAKGMHTSFSVWLQLFLSAERHSLGIFKGVIAHLPE